MEVYRRCRDMLSLTLGAEVSAETESIYRKLKQG